MPNESVRFLPHAQILSFEEITRFVRIVAGAGVNRLRLTGGEPLVRAHLATLVEMLSRINGIEDIALTTNGILLADQAEDLKRAGLSRLNISLDTLDPKKFEQIARRKGLERVLEGISVARQAGFQKIRINAVAIAGITESEIIPLVEFTRHNGLELRFIEFMPLDADKNWTSPHVLTGARIRAMIEQKFGRLTPVQPLYASQPATDYRLADSAVVVGFINPVSQPFCASCNRLRITAEGKIRNCLFSTVEWSVRELLRDPAVSDQAVLQHVRECVAAKKSGHGIDSADFQRPEKAMYQIGG
jgi:cyclic pyranopterin phosphate synthase